MTTGRVTVTVSLRLTRTMRMTGRSKTVGFPL